MTIEAKRNQSRCILNLIREHFNKFRLIGPFITSTLIYILQCNDLVEKDQQIKLNNYGLTQFCAAKGSIRSFTEENGLAEKQEAENMQKFAQNAKGTLFVKLTFYITYYQSTSYCQ